MAGEHGEHGQTPDDRRAPPTVIGDANTTLKCPEGTAMHEGDKPEGLERWCDRAGSMHGPYVRYFTDGEKAVEGAYANNLPDGLWNWYFASGEKASKGSYRDGKEVGGWTYWYESGARKEEGDFLQGRRAGTWTTWYESGRKQGEGMYQNGQRNGVWVFYRDDDVNSARRRETWVYGKLTDEKEVTPKK